MQELSDTEKESTQVTLENHAFAHSPSYVVFGKSRIEENITFLAVFQDIATKLNDPITNYGQ